MERIWHFNADHDIDLADGVEDAIQIGVDRLIDFPLIGRADGKGRRLLIARNRYIAAYGVEDDEVVIFAVYSTRENR